MAACDENLAVSECQVGMHNRNSVFFMPVTYYVSRNINGCDTNCRFLGEALECGDEQRGSGGVGYCLI